VKTPMLVRLPPRVSAYDIAWHCNVSKEAVHKWARIGRIPLPYRPGGHKCYWDREVLERLLFEREQAEVTEPATE
jgi:DNA-binding transcriptional MerR regulator